MAGPNVTPYDFEVHPLAALFPDLPTDEFKKLKKDIEDYGQKEPVWLSADGTTLLDGRHRLRACKELGIEPLTVRRSETGEGEGNFIWSRNVLRRHLTADQRAAIAHKWSDTERQAAKERQKQHGGTAPGKPKENTLGESAKSVHTREAIAEKAHVSQHKVRQVETVAKLKPELLPKIESGTMKLKDAVKEIKPKPEPPAFDEQAVLTRLFKSWEDGVKKCWPKDRDLTPVIGKVNLFSICLTGRQRVRDAKQKKKIAALGIEVEKDVRHVQAGARMFPDLT